ncbi:hypothetical protein PAMP_017893 [Pampus punctatissimus]
MEGLVVENAKLEHHSFLAAAPQLVARPLTQFHEERRRSSPPIHTQLCNQSVRIFFYLIVVTKEFDIFHTAELLLHWTKLGFAIN